MPPSLHIPVTVKNLTAARAGDAVTLQWTMPKRATDKVLLEGLQHAQVCRLADPALDATAKTPVHTQPKCVPAGDLTALPGATASYVDHLPAALEAGAPRALEYAVRLYSPYKSTAGYSNRATVVAGAAPPAVGMVTAQTQADGVVLRWQPQAPEAGMQMRMVRTLLDPKAKKKSRGMMGSAEPEQQVLEVSLAHHDAGQALDKHAALDHIYTYVLQRVVLLKVNGVSAELGGTKSPTVTIDAKDVFPPSVPRQLAAVADGEAGAIDLSWEPSAQTDTAGYIVFRRVAGGAWQRISPERQLVTVPAWSDKTAQPGVRYQYSIAAVDRDGNQSARSSSVEEALPLQHH